MIANGALVLNIFFTMGILASFQAGFPSGLRGKTGDGAELRERHRKLVGKLQCHCPDPFVRGGVI